MGSKLDITGHKFGELIAISNTGKKRQNSFIWQFKCSCGKYVERAINTLRSNMKKNPGSKPSCGCLKKVNEAPINEAYNSYKQNAKRRELSFHLSLKDFHRLAHGNCHYCGGQPIRKRYNDGRLYKTNGIDRLRSDLGYFLDNCVSCCTTCNIMKRDTDYHHFMEMITRIYLNQNNGNDDDTRSVYRRERNCGMRGSAILKHVYDMVEIDNLQKADIKGLLLTLIDDHIAEFDELTGKTS